MSVGNSVEDCSFVQNLLRKIVILERTVQSQGKLYIPWVVNFCRNILTMGRKFDSSWNNVAFAYLVFILMFSNTLSDTLYLLFNQNYKIKWSKIFSLSEMPVWIPKVWILLYNLYVIEMNPSDSGKSFGVSQ